MTTRVPPIVALAFAFLLGLAAAAAAGPISPHPDNPRYFLFQGKPTFLITSGDRYGAVLNLDFDFVPYLDELRARGFNLGRTFSGAHRAVPGSWSPPPPTDPPDAPWRAAWAGTPTSSSGSWTRASGLSRIGGQGGRATSPTAKSALIRPPRPETRRLTWTRKEA